MTKFSTFTATLSLALTVQAADALDFCGRDRGRLLTGDAKLEAQGVTFVGGYSLTHRGKSHIEPGQFCHWETEEGQTVYTLRPERNGEGRCGWYREDPPEKLVMDIPTDAEDQLERRLFDNHYRGPLDPAPVNGENLANRFDIFCRLDALEDRIDSMEKEHTNWCCVRK